MPTPPPTTPFDWQTPLGISRSGPLLPQYPPRQILNPSAPMLAWRIEFGLSSTDAHAYAIERSCRKWPLIEGPGWQWDSWPMSVYIRHKAIAAFLAWPAPGNTWAWTHSAWTRTAATAAYKLSPGPQLDPFPYTTPGPHRETGGGTDRWLSLPRQVITAKTSPSHVPWPVSRPVVIIP